MKGYSTASRPAMRATADDVRSWRDEIWAGSLARESGEVLPGVFYSPPPATWHYWVGVSCVDRFRDDSAFRLEEAYRLALRRLAQETGTHLCSHYAVAPAKDASVHLHAVLGIDPGAAGSLVERLTPRRTLGALPERVVPVQHEDGEEPAAIEVPTIRYIGDLLVTATKAAALRLRNGGLYINPYLERGYVSGGLTIKNDEALQRHVVAEAADLAASEYIEEQRSVGHAEPIWT